MAYGMIDPWSSDLQDLPLTIRYESRVNSRMFVEGKGRGLFVFLTQ